MEIKSVSGCAIGKGLFASFAGYENTETLPIRMVTECVDRLSKNCGINKCPRFRTGFMGSHKISWRKENARI